MNNIDHKIKIEDIYEIISLYQNGMSTVKISKIYDVSTTPITRILKENNIKIRNYSDMNKKYTIDEKYFDEIDNDNKAYILGFIYADGHNNVNKNTVVIKIHIKDISVLEFIKKELRTNRPIFINGDYCSIHISNKHISNKLLSYGVDSNKSYNIKFPNYINKKHYNSFILGFFDGDGCIFIQEDKYMKGNFSITSNSSFLKKIEDIFKDELGINSSYTIRHKERNNNIKTLNVCGNLQILKIFEWLYKNTSIYYFNRKFNNFMKIVNYKENKRIKKLKKIEVEIINSISINILKMWNDCLILELYNKDKLSLTRISKKMKIGKDKIKKVLNESNVKIRDKREYDEYRILKLKESFMN